MQTSRLVFAERDVCIKKSGKIYLTESVVAENLY